MEHHIICDPVHGIMEFDNEIKKIIKPLMDTYYFQRLRNIRQLSFVDYVYPGAVHTRFSHSLGTAYLANHVAEILLPEENKKIESYNKKDEIKKVVVAALLHDIGHGPFSHAFEKIYGKNKDGTDKEISHEKWGLKFLDELPQQIKENKEELERLLKEAQEILLKRKGILSQIISSQLDVDRFDYLLRDSHFCGVTYGHFDVNWLISCMKKNDGKIVIIPKGVRSVEHYVMARRLMHHNVYYHKITRVLIYLLKVLLQKIIESNPPDCFSPDLKDFISLVSVNREKDDFENFIINNGFKYYSQITDNDLFMSIKELSKNSTNLDISEISNRIVNRDFPIVLHVIETKIDYVKENITALKKEVHGLPDWRLHFDDQTLLKIYEINLDEIRVVDTQTKEKLDGSDEFFPYSSILEYSDLLKTFAEKKDRFAYIYYCPNGDNAIKKKIKEKFDLLFKEKCFYNYISNNKFLLQD